MRIITSGSRILIRNTEFKYFNSKIVTKLYKIWSEMFTPNPGSRIRLFFHPGSRIQVSKKHWIPDPDPQHCFQPSSTRAIVFTVFRVGTGDLDCMISAWKPSSWPYFGKLSALYNRVQYVTYAGPQCIFRQCGGGGWPAVTNVVTTSFEKEKYHTPPPFTGERHSQAIPIIRLAAPLRLCQLPL